MNMSLTDKFTRCWLALAAIGLVAAGNSLYAGEIHSDFDPGGTYFGGTEGWFNYGGATDFTTATPTGGTTAWLSVKPFQYFGNVTSQSWAVPDVTVADWNSNSTFEFDILVDSLWLPNDAAKAIAVEFQVGGGVGGTINQYAYPTINTSLKDTVQHVSIPLAGMQPFDPTATFWNLSINLNPGYSYDWDSGNPNVQPYNPRYYLDNLEWVSAIPEPTSLLLVSVCGLVLFSSRRFGA